MTKSNLQRSHSNELLAHDIKEIFTKLFDDARNRDEFEFCCTLLRFRGLEDQGWDPLRESSELIQQMLASIASPIVESFRIRQILFLYCHITEMHDLYHVVANMLMVTAGHRYNLNCFSGKTAIAQKPANYPNSKAINIEIWAHANGIPKLGLLFGDLVVNEVRNAFFHSDYILTPDSFNIRRGQGVKIGNVIDPKVKLEWLIPRLQLGINIGLGLISFVQSSIASYEANKTVKTRFYGDNAPFGEMELTTNPGHGLTGFRSPLKG
ncbi:MAG: hypothetical protein EOP04_04875 [Proteobacteria bacterium]|nr:MAG: hypothetical protein EOP04_04875 [Pseudomonadota bacterium]